jgi:hypothetical protein
MKRRQCLTLLAGGLLAAGALRAIAAFAEGIGHWTIGTPMPEVAVAEVGGKIYVVGDRALEPRRRHSTHAASCGGGRLAGQALRRRWLCRGLDVDRQRARIRSGERPVETARRSAHAARGAGGRRRDRGQRGRGETRRVIVEALCLAETGRRLRPLMAARRLISVSVA